MRSFFIILLAISLLGIIFKFTYVSFTELNFDKPFSKFTNFKCLLQDQVSLNDDSAIKYLSSARRNLRSCETIFSYQNVISIDRNTIKLDFDLLSQLTNLTKESFFCYAYKFDKKMNISEQSQKIEIIQPIYYFNSSEINLSTYGFFYVICENKTINKSRVFDQVLTVYPEDMTKLIKDRQNYITPNQSSVHKLPSLNLSDEKKMNVLILGIDSVSYKHFKRILPLTFDYLSSLENNVVFDHFNSVGGSTFPNVLAMLSGILEYDLNDKLKSEIDEYRKIYSTFHDHIPFIWYDYEKNGYFTMFQEDLPSIAIFNYLKKGFKQWPTDLYGRPYWSKYYAKRSGPYKCHFGYPTYFTWFDMMKNFFKAMQDSRKKIPFFSFNYLTEYTHDYFTIPDKMDDHLRNFLKQLVLDDTLFIFFTDHGNKLTSYSYQTEMGRMEKFLPFLSVKVPNKLVNSVYHENLKKNKNKLISFFDLFQTLRQFLFLNNHGTTSGYEHEFRNNSINERAKRGISLFEMVPLDRSCVEAYIPQKICPCVEFMIINEKMFKSETRFDFKMISNFVLEHVNSKTSMIRSKCVEYKFKKLVKIQKSSSKVNLFYRIVYVLQPGEAWFESFVSFVGNKFKFNSDTVRLSAYNDQPYCVNDSTLKQFCFCF